MVGMGEWIDPGTHETARYERGGRHLQDSTIRIRSEHVSMGDGTGSLDRINLWKEAEELEAQVLEISQKMLGAEHQLQ